MVYASAQTYDTFKIGDTPVTRSATPPDRPVWWRPPPLRPLIIVLVVRSALYLTVVALAGLLVILGYDVRLVGGFVAVVAAAAAAASLRLTGGLVTLR